MLSLFCGTTSTIRLVFYDKIKQSNILFIWLKFNKLEKLSFFQ